MIALLPGFLTAGAANIKPGQSSQQAISILGDPIGTLELGNKTILIYPQGDLTLRDDKVSNIDLMTDAQFAAEQERKHLEREEWLMKQEKLAADRFKEGSQLKSDKLQSGTFAALPAKQRVDYWRSFQMRYPEVDVTEELTAALEDRQTELAEEQTLRRIAELEARVARAEQAAIAAQTENESLRNRITIQDNAYQNRYIYYNARPYTICYPQKKVIIRNNGNTVVRYSNQSTDFCKSRRGAFRVSRREICSER